MLIRRDFLAILGSLPLVGLVKKKRPPLYEQIGVLLAHSLFDKIDKTKINPNIPVGFDGNYWVAWDKTKPVEQMFRLSMTYGGEIVYTDIPIRLDAISNQDLDKVINKAIDSFAKLMS